MLQIVVKFYLSAQEMSYRPVLPTLLPHVVRSSDAPFDSSDDKLESQWATRVGE
jgi:hypothetical protein